MVIHTEIWLYNHGHTYRSLVCITMVILVCITMVTHTENWYVTPWLYIQKSGMYKHGKKYRKLVCITKVKHDDNWNV